MAIRRRDMTRPLSPSLQSLTPPSPASLPSALRYSSLAFLLPLFLPLPKFSLTGSTSNREGENGMQDQAEETSEECSWV